MALEISGLAAIASFRRLSEVMNSRERKCSLKWIEQADWRRAWDIHLRWPMCIICLTDCGAWADRGGPKKTKGPEKVGDRHCYIECLRHAGRGDFYGRL